MCSILMSRPISALWQTSSVVAGPRGKKRVVEMGTVAIIIIIIAGVHPPPRPTIHASLVIIGRVVTALMQHQYMSHFCDCHGHSITVSRSHVDVKDFQVAISFVLA
jgi:hypothetical protein